MQNPTLKTPISRCLHLGYFSRRALGKLPQNQALAAFAAKANDATAALEAANLAYEQAKVLIVEARVDVKFADVLSDAEVKQLLRRATLADGRANGPIFKALAPDGQTPLVKPFGQAQVDVLIDLEGKLQSFAATWPDAAQEKAVVEGLRVAYEAALEGRKNAWQNARNLRMARNLAKQGFVKGYNETSLGVKALYQDDKKMIELFFDEVENDVEKDLGEEEAPPGEATPGGG